MWFDGQRQPNTIYVANTSRGKDSTAMLRAIQLMGWPLDMICSVDIWFDDDTAAELPPMVAFKDEYDRKVLDWFGVPVTRLCATKDQKRLTYCDIFYRQITPKREREREAYRQLQQTGRKLPNLRLAIPERPVVPVGSQTLSTLGFPSQMCRWCTGELKNAARPTVSQCGGGTGVPPSNQRFPPYPSEGRLVVSRQTQTIQRKGKTDHLPLHLAPGRGAENKYRPLHRHCRRRTAPHRQAHAEEGPGAAAGADRLGRRSVRS